MIINKVLIAFFAITMFFTLALWGAGEPEDMDMMEDEMSDEMDDEMKDGSGESDGAELSSSTMTRLATVPPGAEVTGIMVNEEGTLFFNSQHPAGEDELVDDAPAALIGYVAGFDANRDAVQDLTLPPESQWDQVHTGVGEYVVLGRAGDRIGAGQVLGGVYDVNGNLMYISNDVDFNAFVALGTDRAYLYTAWEGAARKGASAVSRLLLERSGGYWSANQARSEMLNLESIGGGWVLCYGSVSPWGSLLLAEEYFFYNTALWNHPDNYDEDERPGFAGGNDPTYHMPKVMQQYLGGRMSNPYRYGYTIEVLNPELGDPTFVRRVALGRYSHENAITMPDRRTVYLSDDDSIRYTNAFNSNSGGVLFKFVADRVDDLSSGTLYAAKVRQDSSQDPSRSGFDVQWIELAKGVQSEIEGWIDEYEGIDLDDWQEGESSYLSDDEVNAWAEGKLRRDLNGNGTIERYPDDRPAFLESRKAAAALGATAEWNKMEGVTADGENFYMAISEIGFSMSADWGSTEWDSGAKDDSDDGDIYLETELCGVLYYAALDSNWDISRIEPALVGRTSGDGECDPNTMANPDNILAYDRGLLIAEDSGGQHPLDMLWLWQQ